MTELLISSEELNMGNGSQFLYRVSTQYSRIKPVTGYSTTRYFALYIAHSIFLRYSYNFIEQLRYELQCVRIPRQSYQQLSWASEKSRQSSDVVVACTFSRYLSMHSRKCLKHSWDKLCRHLHETLELSSASIIGAFLTLDAPLVTIAFGAEDRCV